GEVVFASRLQNVELRLLLALADRFEPTYGKELAAAVGKPRPSVNRGLRALVALGLAERHASGRENSPVRWSTTSAGRDWAGCFLAQPKAPRLKLDGNVIGPGYAQSVRQLIERQRRTALAD